MPANTPEGSPEARAWLIEHWDGDERIENDIIDRLAPQLDALVERSNEAAIEELADLYGLPADAYWRARSRMALAAARRAAFGEE